MLGRERESQENRENLPERETTVSDRETGKCGEKEREKERERER